MLVLSLIIPGRVHAVRALVEAVAGFNPDAGIGLVDLRESSDEIAGAEVLDPADMVPPEIWARLRLLSGDPVHLADRVLPFALRWASRESERVVFLHPTTLLLSPLDDLVQNAECITLHSSLTAVDAVADDGLRPSTLDEVCRGAVLPSPIVVGAGSAPALNWLCSCISAHHIAPAALGGTQGIRTVDWLAAMPNELGKRVSSKGEWGRTPAALSGADVLDETGVLIVDGIRVRSLDVGELDPARPWLASSKFVDKPRVRFSEHPGLRRVCRTWLERIEEMPPETSTDATGETLGDGTPVDARMRAAYAHAVLHGDDIDGDPFTPDGAVAFRDWLRAAAPNHRLGRYLLQVWLHRPDLRAAFPDAPNSQSNQFLSWALDSAVGEEGVPDWVLPDDKRAERNAADVAAVANTPTRQGVLVSGYLSAVMGLGEAARLVVDAVAGSGIDHATFNYTATIAQQGDATAATHEGSERLDTHVACVNIDTFTRFANDVGPSFFRGRHTIGLWFWEASVIPDDVLPAFDLVSEIWVASEFVAEIMQRYTDKPVRIFPQPVPTPKRSALSRSELGLPDAFTFLFAFDFNSVLERKNPLGLVEAFCAAFAPGEGPRLVLKTINGERHVGDLERLRFVAADRDDIEVVDEFFPAWKRDAWTAECDCYVSLHRSEGFGLTMAEAMALGKPVIATRYGGNLAFMDDGNSLLVEARSALVPAGCGPYPEGAVWADPDVRQAAEHMRAVYEDQALRDRIGAAAREHIARHHSNEAMADWVTATLQSRWTVDEDPPAPAEPRTKARRIARRLATLRLS